MRARPAAGDARASANRALLGQLPRCRGRLESIRRAIARSGVDALPRARPADPPRPGHDEHLARSVKDSPPPQLPAIARNWMSSRPSRRRKKSSVSSCFCPRVPRLAHSMGCIHDHPERAPRFMLGSQDCEVLTKRKWHRQVASLSIRCSQRQPTCKR